MKSWLESCGGMLWMSGGCLRSSKVEGKRHLYFSERNVTSNLFKTLSFLLSNFCITQFLVHETMYAIFDITSIFSTFNVGQNASTPQSRLRTQTLYMTFSTHHVFPRHATSWARPTAAKYLRMLRLTQLFRFE
jgi:hypothetical protein